MVQSTLLRLYPRMTHHNPNFCHNLYFLGGFLPCIPPGPAPSPLA